MITIYNSNIDFDLDSSNSILLSNSNLVFKTRGLNRITIMDTGNIGIGLENPAAALDVIGTIKSSGMITSTGAGFTGRGDNLTNIPLDGIPLLIPTLALLRGDTSNTTSNLDLNISGTSNILVNRTLLETGFGSNYTGRINSELNTRVENTSNYVLSTSNILVGRIRTEIGLTSNYVLSSSNNLILRENLNDANASNYILSSSNNLILRENLNDANASNYVLTASNNLINKIRENDNNSSNYILTASNNLINKIRENDNNSSNYILTASNNLINKVKENDNNSSNYILTASNNLINKVRENDNNSSNYILTASNNLVNRTNLNDSNSSNYVARITSFLIDYNNLINRPDGAVSTNNANTCNYVLFTSNIVVNRIVEEVGRGSNYTLSSSNNLVNRVVDEVGRGSNYTLSSSNNLVNRVVDEVGRGSNYTLSSSNNLVNRVIAEVGRGSNYTLYSSNDLVNRAIAEVGRGSNYTLSSSNNLVNRVVAEVGFGSNYADRVGIFGSNYTDRVGIFGSNYTDRVGIFGSNYILSTSNILVGRILTEAGFTSNYASRLNAVAMVSSQWTTDSTTIFYNSGNIGIGTTNPINNLHIYSCNNTNIANAKLTIQEANTSNFFSAYPSDIVSVPAATVATTLPSTIDKYMIFTYTTDNTGTGQTQYAITLPENYSCDILMVGGGGGGGGDIGGGGGGGAVLYGSNIIIPAGTYNIKVGAGGSGTGQNGYNTEGFGSICLGGGGAKNIPWESSGSGGANNGNAGGSGGGGKSYKTSGGPAGAGGTVGVSTKSALLAAAVLYNGNVGGAGSQDESDKIQSGGGGGAGTAGGSGLSESNLSGTATGGNGVLINVLNISATNVYWGAGGGGAGYFAAVAGNGGLGGGGAGTKTFFTTSTGTPGASGYSAASGMNAGASTGSGGGGGAGQGTANYPSNGGNGGSGIIIIRYRQIINMKGTPEMQLVIGNTIASGGSNYKIGNYNGDFQIKTSTSNVDTTSLIIQNTANVGIGTNVIMSKLHLYDSTSNAIFTIQDNTSIATLVEPANITTVVVSPASSYTVIISPTSFEKQLLLAYTEESAGFTGQTSYTLTIPEDINVDILVVGGGGAGGNNMGGGGGGGQVLLTTNYNIAAGTSITVNVGKGGVGNTTVGASGQNGFNSSITIAGTQFIANGGGGGGSRNTGITPNTANAGNSGGSGGGSSSGNVVPFAIGGAAVETTYTNWRSFGYNGGIGAIVTGSTVNYYAGGGGGAGKVGGTGVYFNNTVATGGDGVDLSTLFGTSVGANSGFFGGGGGGVNSGSTTTTPAGGFGGGGRGATSVAASDPGTTRTGGGGGGSISSAGANGGSGVVIIRYRQRNREGNAEIQFIKGSSISAGYTNYKIGNYNGDFQIKSSLLGTDTNRLVIGSTGNIGIGTKNPISKLHIYNNTSNITALTIENYSIFPAALYATNPSGVTSGTIGTTDRFYIFTHIGEFDTNTAYNNVPIPAGITFDLFMIGGGGAGGGIGGSGGGSGACLVALNQTIPAGNYDFVVGGAGSINGTGSGRNGYDTYINSTGGVTQYRARGGGGGAADNKDGIVGGCSGGAAGGVNNVVYISPAPATDNCYQTQLSGPVGNTSFIYGIYGNKGGDSDLSSTFYTYAGGGGIGTAAANANATIPILSTSGGDGLYQVTLNEKPYNLRTHFTNNGTFGVQDGSTGNYYIGGGGGGGGYYPYFSMNIEGGKGGGGIGKFGNLSANGTAGTANTGSGGGGGSTGLGGRSYGGNGGSGLLIFRYRVPNNSSTSIEFINGNQTDYITNYKIGNYNGDFQIKSSLLGTDTNRLVIGSTGNVTLSGSLNAASYLLNGAPFSIATEVGNASNYVLSTSNFFANRVSSQWTTSNNMIYYNTSNVGIGTHNPINKLHLYEDITNNTKLIVQNNYILNIQPIVPTGTSITTGSITTTVNSTDRYMIFTTGTSSFTVPSGGINCDILMIGGGGAGGRAFGGGGGAGACIVAINQTLTEGAYNAIVGDGDAASTADSGAGGNSFISFSGGGATRYLARGGGRGQQNTANGIDGGCGGGGGWGSGATRSGGNPLTTNIVNGSAANIAPTGPATIGLDYVVLGYKGGNQEDTGATTNTAGPGGGGIGGEGINHPINSSSGTAGGPGLNQVTINSQIYNFQSWFANGGAFGVNSGYIGSGGSGFTPSVSPVSGTANTGSGGGAGERIGGSSSGGSGIIIIRYRMPSTIIGSPSIELIKGTSGDTNVDYKIGNYQDSFKIVSSVSGTDTDRLVLNNNGNITLSGSVNASSYLLNNINILTNITDTSNYVLSTSNNLVNRIVEEVGRGSNYALSSSNNLVNRIVDEVGRGSNYTLYSSNDLVNRIVDEVGRGSNYVLSTSNNLVNRVVDEVGRGSNYVLSTSNILAKRTTDEVVYSSNYTERLDNRNSNYVLITSNILAKRATDEIINTSNYVLSTSNFFANRVSSQWTDVSSGIYYNTSNVGIGTTNPISKLHIYDNINNITALTIQNNYIPTLPDTLYTTNPSGVTSGTIGTSDRFYIFTHTGGFDTNTLYNNVPIPAGITFDLFMIGGGGAGGGIGGSGGGSGACLVALNQTITAGNYAFVVGGAGSINGTGSGRNGYDTYINNTGGVTQYRANGGGGGSADNKDGIVGGCSGGAAGGINNVAYISPAPATNNCYQTQLSGPVGNTSFIYGIYGNKGGDSIASTNIYTYGGGGGIGAAAANANSTIRATTGGDGLYQVTLNNTTYNLRTHFTNNGTFGVQDGSTDNYFIGGGGGSGGYNESTAPTNIAGGKGGGGIGKNGNSKQNGTDGEPKTGSGGGAGSTGIDGNAFGGNGGSGLLIFRYRFKCISGIEFINENQTNYKLGNYNGEFQIKSSVASVDTNRLVISSTGNLTLSGSVNASSYLLNNINILTNITDTSNYVSIIKPATCVLADTATKLATARTIGGTSFDGSGNIAIATATYATSAGSATSATSATRLETPRKINNVNFDGTADITISTGTTSQWTGTNPIYYNGGNVGIGTAVPLSSFKLHVNGSAHINGQIVCNNDYNETLACNKIVLWSGEVNEPTTYQQSGFGISIGTVDYFSNGNAGKGRHRWWTGSQGASLGTRTMSLTGDGYLGIGMDPIFRLDVASAALQSATVNMRYFNYDTALSTGNTNMADTCAKFHSSIWVLSWISSSSDTRIKEDIQDINDDSALQMILAIEPKTYKYVDKVAKGDKKVYGFIAQQIRQVIPDAVNLQNDFIPNIMLLAEYNSISNTITLPSQPSKVVIKINDIIKCYDAENKQVEIEVCEIIDELTFKIKDIKDIKYTDTKIFLHGTKIDDFHTLSKDYIFTLNVCATQELHRLIEAQNVIIKSQDDRIKDLETKVAMLLNNSSSN